MNLRESKVRNAKLSANFIPYFLLLLSFLGFIDATFLTVLHYQHLTPPCTLTHGCEKVLTSKFAVINGIPIALVGSIYFFFLIILCVLLLQKNQRWLKQTLLILTALGTLAAIILLYIQLLILNSLCWYCFLVELIIFLLFAFSIIFTFRVK